MIYTIDFLMVASAVIEADSDAEALEKLRCFGHEVDCVLMTGRGSEIEITSAGGPVEDRDIPSGWLPSIVCIDGNYDRESELLAPALEQLAQVAEGEET